MQTEWRRESLELAQEIKRHAEARGTSASQFAIAWVLNNALVTGTIAEPRTFEQWGHYLGASLRTTGSIFTKISWFISA